MGYSTVIFDVDGTLLDTSDGILASVKYTVRKFGLRELSEQEILTFIGPPVQNSFRRIYGADGEILENLTVCFRERYKKEDLLKARPYNGIYALCDALSEKGIGIAVATYKRHDYAIKLLKHFQFERYSKVMYGADHENKLTKADIIKKCLMDLKVTDYSKVLMIGDTEHDALGAEKMGIDFLGVTFGFGFRNESDVSQFTSVGSVDQPMDILKYI